MSGPIKIDNRISLYAVGSREDNALNDKVVNSGSIINPEQSESIQIEAGSSFIFNDQVIVSSNENFEITINPGDKYVVDDNDGKILAIYTQDNQLHGFNKKGEEFKTPYKLSSFKSAIDNAMGKTDLAGGVTVYETQTNTEIAESLSGKDDENWNEHTEKLTVKLFKGQSVVITNRATGVDATVSEKSTVITAEKDNLELTVPAGSFSYQEDGAYKEFVVPENSKVTFNGTGYSFAELKKESDDAKAELPEQHSVPETPVVLGVHVKPALIGAVAVPAVTYVAATNTNTGIMPLDYVTEMLRESFLIGAAAKLGLGGKATRNLIRRGDLVVQGFTSDDNSQLKNQLITEALHVAREEASRAFKETDGVIRRGSDYLTRIQKVAENAGRNFTGNVKDVAKAKAFATELDNIVGEVDLNNPKAVNSTVDDLARLESALVADQEVKVAAKTPGWFSKTTSKAGEVLSALKNSNAVQLGLKGVEVAAPLTEMLFGAYQAREANLALRNTEGMSENEINKLESQRAEGVTNTIAGWGTLTTAALIGGPAGWAFLAGAGFLYLADMGVEYVTGKSTVKWLTDAAYGVEDEKPKGEMVEVTPLTENQMTVQSLEANQMQKETTTVALGLVSRDFDTVKPESEVFKGGNQEDAALLAAFYKQLSNMDEAGLNNHRKEKLKYLDNILGGSEIKVDGKNAVVTETQGSTKYSYSVSDSNLSAHYGQAKIEGNEDTQLLVAAYEAFLKDDGKISAGELAKLKYLDEKLGGAVLNASDLSTKNTLHIWDETARKTFTLTRA